MAKTSFIAVDIGTSETRISADGVATLRIPNNCVFLEKPTPPDFSGGGDTLSSLEVMIAEAGKEPIYALYGQMAERCTSVNQRPSPMEAKYKQRINHVSIIMGAALARMERDGSNADMNLHLALPPVEVNKAREALVNAIGGEYMVEFPKLGRKMRVKFANIYCYEESRMAGVAFLPQLSDEYREGSVLSVDIGAGTTDLALFTSGIFYERSARTYKIGGNTAREYLIEAVSEEYDFEPSVAEASKIVATNELRLGNRKIPVVEIVNEVKRRFASELVEAFQQYFRAVGTSIQTINAFLVSGGGSLSGGVKGARSVASYVIEALQGACPGIEALEYNGDPQLANLDGLCKTAIALEDNMPAGIKTVDSQDVPAKAASKGAAKTASKAAKENVEVVDLQ